jgi:FkbM family methyltransferase
VGSEPGVPFSAAVPFLPSNPVIIEAGASSGMDLPGLTALWPQGTIHAFEPEPFAYQQLVECAKSFPHVRTWNLALGRDDGVIEMHVSHGIHGTTSSSLRAPTLTRAAHPDITFSQVKVEQRTLSSWAQEHNVDRIDFLALDMQGYEHAALDAARSVVRNVSVVIAEAFLVEMYEGSPTVDELEALLTGEGFVILETHVFYAETFEVLAVRREALADAIFSGRLATQGAPWASACAPG